MATIGGNLLQRTRCLYFRDPTTPCNKRAPGSGCSALEGQNRMNATLGGSAHCLASHASDLAVALMALNAELVLQGTRGDRTAPLDGLYSLPTDRPQLNTALPPPEKHAHEHLHTA